MAKAKKLMAHTLYLTANEKKLFGKLAANLKQDCEVKDEKRSFHDTNELRAMRKRVARFEHPKLRSLHEEARKMKTPKQLQPLLRSLVMEEFGDADIRELFFLLGPEVLSTFVQSSLRNPKTAEEVEHVATVTLLRRGLLNAFVPA